MISLLTIKRHWFLLGALCASLLPAISNAQLPCVQLMSANGTERSVPINLSSTLRLNFRHSIYGSQVEEVFALRRDGFQLIQLRYAEARLVEFYGHENGQFEDGAWIVTPTPTLVPVLYLHPSSDAAMSLHFERTTNANSLPIRPESSLRLTVTSCKNGTHG
jgi:hypothetical protein